MSRQTKYNTDNKNNTDAADRWDCLVDSEIVRASFLISRNRRYVFVGKLTDYAAQTLDTAHSIRLKKSDISEFCDELKAIANEYMED